MSDYLSFFFKPNPQTSALQSWEEDVVIIDICFTHPFPIVLSLGKCCSVSISCKSRGVSFIEVFRSSGDQGWSWVWLEPLKRQGQERGRKVSLYNIYGILYLRHMNIAFQPINIKTKPVLVHCLVIQTDCQQNCTSSEVWLLSSISSDGAESARSGLFIYIIMSWWDYINCKGEKMQFNSQGNKTSSYCILPHNCSSYHRQNVSLPLWLSGWT